MNIGALLSTRTHHVILESTTNRRALSTTHQKFKKNVWVFNQGGDFFKSEKSHCYYREHLPLKYKDVVNVMLAIPQLVDSISLLLFISQNIGWLNSFLTKKCNYYQNKCQQSNNWQTLGILQASCP